MQLVLDPINVGMTPNDRTGDNERASWSKQNAMNTGIFADLTTLYNRSADPLNLAAQVASNTSALTTLMAGASPALDSFVEVYTRFLQDESAVASLQGAISAKLDKTGDASNATIALPAGGTITLATAITGKAALGANSDILSLSALNSILVTGTNPLTVPFAPSPGVTHQSTVSLALTSGYENQMEFGLAVNMLVNKGFAQYANGASDGTSYKAAKVAIYGGVDVRPGGGSGYALNTAAIFRSGVGVQPMISAEFNLNNENMHVGDLDGDVAGGLFSPPAYYLYLTGGGSKRVTSVFAIDLANANGASNSSFGTMANRGIVGFNGALAKSWIEDATNARESYLMRNTKTNAGFDTRQAAITTNLVLAMASPHLLSWRNSANNADLALIGKAANDYLRLGGGVSPINLNPAAGSNLLIRPFINFNSGVTIQSINDAQNAAQNLELLAPSTLINGGLFISKTGATNGGAVKVTSGATDSGGSGFQVLRVPNGSTIT